MGRFTSFEVQVYQNGRWSIHAQYAANQRDHAISEAKKIEATPGFDGVKVVKEVYDSDASTHRDYTVYRGPKDFQEHKGFRDIGGDGSSGGGGDDWGAPSAFGSPGDDFNWDYEDFEDETPKRKKRQRRPRDQKATTVTGAVLRMLFVALISVVVASVFTYAFSWFYSGEEVLGVRLVGNAEANALFLVFSITFLLTASSIAYQSFSRMRLKSRRRRRAANRPPPLPASNVTAGGSAWPAGELVEEATTISDWRNEAVTAEELAEQLKQDSDDTNQRLREQLYGPQAQGAEEEAPPMPSAEATVGALDASGEKQKAYMMKFVSEVVGTMEGDKKKLDNYTKFGLNLFLAGACEALARARSIPDGVRSRILADSVQVLGFKKSHAGTFAERYEEYLLQDARYMNMFQAGRNAMADNLAGGGNKNHVEAALKDWSQPKPKQDVPSVVAVMFTDIAGSTALTQKLGDAGAQEVVRAHNRIVRDALTRFNGKEVKHTGDGMMCSFAQPTNAVDAAVRIQRETAAYFTANPDKPLKIKIGVNAGEPIAEDNDLFGTTVQLAARIVDKASAGEIFVSETMRGICTGKGHTFNNRGGFAMKGFGEDMVIYEVVWNAGLTAKAS